MNIFEKLSAHDVDMLHGYLDSYGDNENNNYAISRSLMDHFLRFWNTNKAPLYKMFGEQFIIKKEICFEKPLGELDEEMYAALYGHKNIAARRFVEKFRRAIGNDVFDDFDTTYAVQDFVDNTALLISNVYQGNSITIPGRKTKDGRPLQINKGCKVVKMVGKIATALDIDNTTYYLCPECGYQHEHRRTCYCGCEELKTISGYEAFRRAHSMVLNQKVLKGNLCLSIHPLDYVTMSDNECGWSSCMQWMEESGDYRLGTIEMMNSPYIVVAYVESHTPMNLCSYPGWDWNNKRWRQLYVVTPDFILGNRQYPYENDALQGAAIKWLRQLAMDNLGYGPFPEETSIIVNNSRNTIGNESVYVRLGFSYMYNDIYGDRLAYVAMNFDEDSFAMNLSGPAVCTCCGEVIEYSSDFEASSVRCRECDGYWQCDCCGDWHGGEPYYADGKYYCNWCYYNELHECEVCGERSCDTTNVYIQMFPNPENDDELSYNWGYEIKICPKCLENAEEAEKLFGHIFIVKDMFGRERYAVSIDGISDEGLRRGAAGVKLFERLKAARDAKTPKKRLKVLEKNLY